MGEPAARTESLSAIQQSLDLVQTHIRSLQKRQQSLAQQMAATAEAVRRLGGSKAPSVTVGDEADGDYERSTTGVTTAFPFSSLNTYRSSLPVSDGNKYQDDPSDQPTHARILVSDADAGILIGRAGSGVVDIKSTSGALVKISRRGQLLPGTDCRVLLVSGQLHQVMDATELILQKIFYEGAVVLVVPDACCGTLIGKGGSVIRSLAVSSNARIVISNYDESYGMHDRLVTVTGHLDNQLQAIFLILLELLKDEHYSWCSEGPVFLGCAKGYVPDEHVERYHRRPKKPMQSPSSNDDHDAQQSRTIAIADEHIGAVIGYGGRKLRELQKVSGARIRTSAKGEFVAQTRERVVVISGTREAIDAAERMIMHVVSAIRSGGGEKPPLKPDTTPQQLDQ